MLRTYTLVLCLVAATQAALAAAAPAAPPPDPETFLGHPVGADRKLAPYSKVLEYLRLVDAASTASRSSPPASPPSATRWSRSS